MATEPEVLNQRPNDSVTGLLYLAPKSNVCNYLILVMARLIS